MLRLTRRLCILAAGILVSLVLCSGLAYAADPAAQKPVLDISYQILDISITTASLDNALTITESNVAETLVLSADIAFAFDKADLNASAAQTLSEVAAKINAGAKGVVQVDGYTDALGTASYNQDLSESRAQAVVAALQPMVSRPGVAFDAAGHGANNPVAPNKKADGSDNPDGRASNRRVSIRFAKG